MILPGIPDQLLKKLKFKTHPKHQPDILACSSEKRNEKLMILMPRNDMFDLELMISLKDAKKLIKKISFTKTHIMSSYNVGCWCFAVSNYRRYLVRVPLISKTTKAKFFNSAFVLLFGFQRKNKKILEHWTVDNQRGQSSQKKTWSFFKLSIPANSS